MSKLKVFGISWSGNTRVIIATTSMKKASEILSTSYTHFRTYGCETTNENEIKKALSNPGVPFITKDNYDNNAVYKKFEGYKK